MSVFTSRLAPILGAFFILGVCFLNESSACLGLFRGTEPNQQVVEASQHFAPETGDGLYLSNLRVEGDDAYFSRLYDQIRRFEALDQSPENLIDVKRSDQFRAALGHLGADLLPILEYLFSVKEVIEAGTSQYAPVKRLGLRFMITGFEGQPVQNTFHVHAASSSAFFGTFNLPVRQKKGILRWVSAKLNPITNPEFSGTVFERLDGRQLRVAPGQTVVASDPGRAFSIDGLIFKPKFLESRDHSNNALFESQGKKPERETRRLPGGNQYRHRSGEYQGPAIKIVFELVPLPDPKVTPRSRIPWAVTEEHLALVREYYGPGGLFVRQ